MRHLARILRPPQTSGDDFVIYWTTDTHILAHVSDNPESSEAIKVGKRYIYTAERKFRRWVNRVLLERPDLAVHTGDTVDYYTADSHAVFMQEWERITTPKLLVPGNHDLANTTYGEIVERFGVGDLPENARSKFNQSYTFQKGELTLRILTVDTNIGDDGEHLARPTGYIQSDAAQWVENELSSAGEKVALIFMHHGPSGPSSYFDNASLGRFNQALENARLANRSLIMYVFWGHHHPFGDWFPSHALALRTMGISGAALVDNLMGRFTILRIAQDGGLRMESGSISYQ